MKLQYTQEYIRQLLDRFMDGTTTLEEEDVLARYFSEHAASSADGDGLPAEWEEYCLLFSELETLKADAALAGNDRRQPARRWWTRWAAAAAVVGVLFTVGVTQLTKSEDPVTPAILTSQADLISQIDLTAQTGPDDSTDVLRPEAPNEEPLPDTALLQRQLQRQPEPPARRRLRKPEPTMTDLDKAAMLLARAEQEQQAVEQQLEQARQNIIHVQLTAAGYTVVQQEDGSIIYIDEPKEYFAYEE